MSYSDFASQTRSQKIVLAHLEAKEKLKLWESPRTNSFTYSEDYSNAAWTKARLNLVANAALAPDGTNTATHVYDDATASSTHIIQRNLASVVTGETWCYSIYAKENAQTNKRFLSIYFPTTIFGATSGAVCNVLNGEMNIFGNATGGRYYDAVSGMWRFYIVSTATASGTALIMTGRFSNSFASAAASYSGDGTSGFYLWGSQVEKITSSYRKPSPYTKTVASTVTQNAYFRQTNHFVTGVSVGGTDLVSAATPYLTAGQYHFDPAEGLLFVRLTDSSNPKLSSIYANYRFFYSNIPCDAPWDITSGTDVHYDSRIKSIGQLKLELDYENTGIALETNSNITLENTDGYFDTIFDALIWENSTAKFYSWSTSLAASDARLIYKGTVTDKSFTDKDVRFSLKDELGKLKQSLTWEKFSDADGEIDSTVDGKHKRLVFGRVDKFRTVGVNKELDGFALTGTISGNADRNLLAGTVQAIAGASTINGVGTSFTTAGLINGSKIRVYSNIVEYTYTVDAVVSNTQITISGTIDASFNAFLIRNLDVKNNILTGTGTDFLDEVSPGDSVNVTVDGVLYDYEVESVDSNTQLTLSQELEATFSALACTNSPDVPYRGINRRWHIAGHKLREYATTISVIESPNMITVADASDITAGDKVKHLTTVYTVIRVSGNTITFNQTLTGALVGATLTKLPVLVAYNGTQEFVIERDFTVENNLTDSVLVLNSLAEFNVATPKNSTLSFTFTNGSTTVTISDTSVSLESFLKPRDWIRRRSVNLPEWYEILSVESQSLTLRTAATSAYAGTIQYKNPEYINDDSLICVDCYGMQDGTTWIKSASNAVEWLLTEAGLTDIDTVAFDEAHNDGPFTLSLYYPETVGGDLPPVRDMITAINGSVFGSLFLNNSFEYAYSVLNADKPETLEAIDDSDILGFSVNTRTNIFNSVLLSYCPQVDLSAMSETFARLELENDFVNEAIGKVEQLKVTCYLYDETDANIIAQRWLFFKSLTQTVVNISTKLNLALTALNDKIYLSLTRLYKRYGGGSRTKIGIVNSITKDGTNTVVQVNDLGNVFNRVPSIAPNTATDDYATATTDEVDKYGYVVDNDTETPDVTSEEELGNNLIG